MKTPITAAAIIRETGSLKKRQEVWVHYSGIPYRGTYIGTTPNGRLIIETLLDENQVDIVDWNPKDVIVKVEIKPKNENGI